MKYGFQLKFAKPFEFVFSDKLGGIQAEKQIREGLRLAGLTKADYHIAPKRGIRKGRGMRVLKGGRRS